MSKSASSDRVVIPFAAHRRSTSRQRLRQSIPFEWPTPLVQSATELQLAVRELLDLCCRPIRNYCAPLVDRYRADVQSGSDRPLRTEVSDDGVLEHFEARLTAVANKIQLPAARDDAVLTLVNMVSKKKAKGLTTLRDRLKDAMIAVGKTAAQLARDCGVSTVAVHKWLSGETRELRNDTCARAAAALNVNPEWLNYGKGLRSGDGSDDKEIQVLLKLKEQLEDSARIIAQHIELRRIARKHGPGILPHTSIAPARTKKKSA